MDEPCRITFSALIEKEDGGRERQGFVLNDDDMVPQLPRDCLFLRVDESEEVLQLPFSRVIDIVQGTLLLDLGLPYLVPLDPQHPSIQ